MIKKFEFDTADRIKIFGKWDSSAFRYDTKLSLILSKLISRAGIICEKNSSDLFDLWDNVAEILCVCDCGGNNGVQISYEIPFGVHTNGVDGTEKIMEQIDEHSRFAEYEYKELYLLRITKYNKNIYAEFATCRIAD